MLMVVTSTALVHTPPYPSTPPHTSPNTPTPVHNNSALSAHPLRTHILTN